MAMFGSRRHEELAALRAEVDSAQARLAADISNLDAGQDPMSRQAMADAGERYTAAGSLLSTASTAGELMVAKRIVAEGLTATRLVRQKQGLPLGSDIPESGAPSVTEPASVLHDSQVHTAYPNYHPDSPHYFGGGTVESTQAPAGYYRTPFWKKAAAMGGAFVAGDVISGALGELLGGGLGGGGYDNDGGLGEDNNSGGDW